MGTSQGVVVVSMRHEYPCRTAVVALAEAVCCIGSRGQRGTSWAEDSGDNTMDIVLISINNELYDQFVVASHPP